MTKFFCQKWLVKKVKNCLKKKNLPARAQIFPYFRYESRSNHQMCLIQFCYIFCLFLAQINETTLKTICFFLNQLCLLLWSELSFLFE